MNMLLRVYKQDIKWNKICIEYIVLCILNKIIAEYPKFNILLNF